MLACSIKVDISHNYSSPTLLILEEIKCPKKKNVKDGSVRCCRD